MLVTEHVKCLQYASLITLYKASNIHVVLSPSHMHFVLMKPLTVFFQIITKFRSVGSL